MNKPKVSILLHTEMRKKIFTEAELKRLRRFASVAIVDYPQLNPDLLKIMIRGAEGVVTGWGTPRLTGDILDEARGLRIIAHSAGSVRPMVSDEVWRRKIVVTTAASSIGIGVAEFALGMLITGLKRVYPFIALTRQGLWREPEERKKIKEFYKITIGIVGAGFAGRHLIKLLKNFDVNILLYDPYVSKEEAAWLGATKTSLSQLMKRSDAVSLHAPSIPATHHMINRLMLGLMKPHALLVNTARGALIDEMALIQVLRKGKLFACLDVTDPEPPAKNNPLRKLKNVVLTPHMAGGVTNNLFRNGRYAVIELERFFQGKKPLYPVTEAMLKKMA